ncbi:hypothetical protein FQN60_004803, partial [Etheostoma spectabile]
VVVSCHFSANRHKWQSTPLPSYHRQTLQILWHHQPHQNQQPLPPPPPVSELHGGIYCRCCCCSDGACMDPVQNLYHGSSCITLWPEGGGWCLSWWKPKSLKQVLTEERGLPGSG